MKNIFKEIRVAKALINYIHIESYKYGDEHLTQLLECALERLHQISLLEDCDSSNDYENSSSDADKLFYN